MFGSQVVEVGIGMALLFLFMSLIASALRELIENLLKSRSRDLERGIVELLDGRRNCGIMAAFYGHPMISSLFSGDYRARGRNLPSYIPRQNFSLAMLDILSGVALARPATSLKELEATLSSIDQPNAIQRVAMMAIQTAEGDLGRVRAAIEDWYDGTMDRVSGWYTRRTGRILGVLGLLAAAFFNVDAITVAEHLGTDKDLRDAVVAEAKARVGAVKDEAAGTPDESLPSLQSRFEQVGFPIGWVTLKPGDWPIPPQICRVETRYAGEKAAETAPAPGGAPAKAPDAAADAAPGAAPGDDPGAAAKTPAPPSAAGPRPCEPQAIRWLWVVLGWAITALAMMLGAPFWFDVLNRFMIVRSTIKPSEKSPDEGSPDRPPSKSPGRERTDPASPGAGNGNLGPGGKAGPGGPAETRPPGESAAAATDATFVPHRWADGREPQAGLM